MFGADRVRALVAEAGLSSRSRRAASAPRTAPPAPAGRRSCWSRHCDRSDTPAYAKGGELPWPGFSTKSFAGQIVVGGDGRKVTFCFIVNWKPPSDDPLSGFPAVEAEFFAAIKGILRVIKRDLQWLAPAIFSAARIPVGCLRRLRFRRVDPPARCRTWIARSRSGLLQLPMRRLLSMDAKDGATVDFRSIPVQDSAARKTMALEFRDIGNHCATSKRPRPLLSVSTLAQPNWPRNLGFASAPQTNIRVFDCASAGTPASLSAIMNSATAIMVNTTLV